MYAGAPAEPPSCDERVQGCRPKAGTPGAETADGTAAPRNPACPVSRETPPA